MPRIKKIGTPLTKYYGKSLFEIAANLKNGGSGRMVSRTNWQQFPQKSFIIITRAYPALFREGFGHGTVFGKKVFRSKAIKSKHVIIALDFPITPEQKISEAFIPDWFLVPKHEEQSYLESLPPPLPKLVTKHIDIPPLLNLLLLRDLEKSGKSNEKPQILRQVLPTANTQFFE